MVVTTIIIIIFSGFSSLQLENSAALYKRNRFKKGVPYGIITQWNCSKLMTSLINYTYCLDSRGLTEPRILDILILQDKTFFCAFEAGNIVCWLVNPPIAKLGLFKSANYRWSCKTYAEYCYRNSATVRRLVQSPTLQSTICCQCPSDLRGKGIRVSPAWLSPASLEAGNELLGLLGWTATKHGSKRINW